VTGELLANVTCVSIEGRGVLIKGKPGSGKSSLALALIDRGAVLIGDDGIWLEQRGERLFALPPPEIAGMLEVRGVGIATLPAGEAPLCLVLTLADHSDRLPEPHTVAVAASSLPHLYFRIGNYDPIRVEWALRLHGLALV